MPLSLDKVMSSRFSVVYIGDQAYPALVQFICPFMMPDFSFHSHSKDKVLAFLVLRHKPIISFVCKIDCHRLFKRLKSILAIASIHRHRHSRLPTDNSGFSCFKTSASKSFLSLNFIESQAI